MGIMNAQLAAKATPTTGAVSRPISVVMDLLAAVTIGIMMLAVAVFDVTSVAKMVIRITTNVNTQMSVIPRPETIQLAITVARPVFRSWLPRTTPPPTSTGMPQSAVLAFDHGTTRALSRLSRSGMTNSGSVPMITATPEFRVFFTMTWYWPPAALYMAGKSQRHSVRRKLPTVTFSPQLSPFRRVGRGTSAPFAAPCVGSGLKVNQRTPKMARLTSTAIGTPISIQTGKLISMPSASRAVWAMRFGGVPISVPMPPAPHAYAIERSPPVKLLLAVLSSRGTSFFAFMNLRMMGTSMFAVAVLLMNIDMTMPVHIMIARSRAGSSPTHFSETSA
mmetsp:Transcript_28676/g.81026  ORF Transcript_28676/g.81026 Transcript_28676/m.81026 type:complete len:334 (-) Transcript_28676:502-1503(-)